MIYWLIAILPFTALSIFTFMGEDILLTYFIAMIIFWFFVMHVFMFSKKRYRIFINRSVKYFAFFLLFIFIANLGGIGKPTKYYTQVINLVVVFLAYFTFLNILNKYNLVKIKKIVDFFVIISVMLSVFSIYQYFAVKCGLPIFDYFRNSNMYYIARDWRAASGWIAGARAYGVAPEPTFWAAFVIIPIAILLPKILQCRFTFKQFLFFCLLNISFVLAFARSSWLTYGAIILIYFLNQLLRIKFHPYVIVSLSLCLVALSSLIYLLFPQITGLSYYMRIAGSLTALRMFVAHPLIGVGWGAFQNHFLNYQLLPGFAEFWANQMQFNAGYAANMYLRVMAEAGLIGLFLFMGIIIPIYKKLSTLILSCEAGSENIVFYQGLLLAFYSILITWYYSEAYNLIYIWFIFAVMSVLPNCQANKDVDYKELN